MVDIWDMAAQWTDDAAGESMWCQVCTVRIGYAELDAHLATDPTDLNPNFLDELCRAITGGPASSSHQRFEGHTGGALRATPGWRSGRCPSGGEDGGDDASL
jgi:hypothetical protein